MSDELEYTKLWMQQSQLFWSRLQTISLFHSAVLVGWYKLFTSEKYQIFAPSVLWVGFSISIFIGFIMIRDSQYMNSIKAKASTAFPTAKRAWIGGRTCAFFIIGFLMAIEMTLYFSQNLGYLAWLLPLLQDKQ